nr:hypothetical protein [uncultured Halomonas sp.]
MSTVKEVLEVIYKESEQAIFSEEQQKNSECLEFLKSINFSVSHLKSIISKEPNDGLKTWNSIVNENPIEEVSVKIFVQSSLVLLCVISKEFLRYSGLSSSAKNSLNSVESCLAKNKEIHYIYVAGERVQIYEKYLAFTLQEERFASIYEQSLEEKFEANLGGQEKRIEKIQADINYGNELLEAIESETGHASLIHGFKEYSKKLNEKRESLLLKRII